MCRGTFRAALEPGRRRGAIAIAAALMLVTASIAPAIAQVTLPVPITLAGDVVWIAGQKMLVATVNNHAYAVDLSAVPLDSYLSLQPGAHVRVTGQWTEGDILKARSLEATPGPPPATDTLR